MLRRTALALSVLCCSVVLGAGACKRADPAATTVVDKASVARDLALQKLPTGPYKGSLELTMPSRDGEVRVVSRVDADPAQGRMRVETRSSVQAEGAPPAMLARFNGSRVLVVSRAEGSPLAGVITADQKALASPRYPFGAGIHLRGTGPSVGTDLVGTLRWALTRGTPRLLPPDQQADAAGPKDIQVLQLTLTPEQFFDGLVDDKAADLLSLGPVLDNVQMGKTFIGMLRDAATLQLVLGPDHVVRGFRQGSALKLNVTVGPLVPTAGVDDAALAFPAEDEKAATDITSKLQEQRTELDKLLADPARLSALRTRFLAAWQQVSVEGQTPPTPQAIPAPSSSVTPTPAPPATP
jgi:hypothetical protein